MQNLLSKISWWIFAISCILIGLYPFIYFILDPAFGLLSTKSPQLLADMLWTTFFYGHIIFGGIALLTGWSQFSASLRRKNLSLHRNLGKAYMLSVLMSGSCGIYIGCFATGGIISSVGFISLGIIWLVSTFMALLAIRNKDIAAHQNWMTISYAGCFGAVTLRIWLPILIALTGSFKVAYPMVAWVSWVPNILVALFLVQNRKRKLHKIP
ncbi:MAG: DUF2306 domain-containing protein [Bacteroidota bacterium]